MTDIADATDNSFISFETGNSNSRDKETLIIKRIVIKVKINEKLELSIANYLSYITFQKIYFKVVLMINPSWIVFLIILNKNDVNKIPDRARQLLRDLMGLFLGLSDLCPTLR